MVNLPKSSLEVTPATKPEKDGPYEHWGFEVVSKGTGSPKRESRGSAAGAGSRLTPGSQLDRHWHLGEAGTHLLLGGKRLEML